MPYQKIMDAVMFGLARADVRRAPGDAAAGRLAAAAPLQRPTSPRPRQLLAEAGYPNGFETTLSFDLGFATVNEPLCVLIQESLAQIGIKTTINKIPGANWRTELLKKEMPLIANVFGGWLNYPEYFFFWCYHGQNAVFNTMSYQNPDDGQADRRGALRAPTTAKYADEREGLRRHGLRRRAAHPALPALPRRGDAEERRRATSTGSTASSTTASWPRREGSLRRGAATRRRPC